MTTTRDQVGGRDRITVVARLTNTGAAARTVDANFTLGDRAVEGRKVTIPAHGSAPVPFSPVLVPEAATRGRVSITPDSLTADDSFQFTVAPDEAISVLIIDPEAPRPNQHLYLARALGIGDHPKFTVAVKKLDEVRPSDFNGRSLVVLNEAMPPSGDAGTRLRALIMSGAGLLVVPGELDVARWPSEWRAMLARQGRDDRGSRGGRRRDDRHGGLRDFDLRDLQRAPERRLLERQDLSLSPP